MGGLFSLMDVGGLFFFDGCGRIIFLFSLMDVGGFFLKLLRKFVIGIIIEKLPLTPRVWTTSSQLQPCTPHKQEAIVVPFILPGTSTTDFQTSTM